jgi:hypothetical protein
MINCLPGLINNINNKKKKIKRGDTNQFNLMEKIKIKK